MKYLKVGDFQSLDKLIKAMSESEKEIIDQWELVRIANTLLLTKKISDDLPHRPGLHALYYAYIKKTSGIEAANKAIKYI